MAKFNPNCVGCGVEKTSENTGVRKSSGGLHSKCKICLSMEWVEYCKKNQEKVKAYHKAYYEKNQDKFKAKSEEYRKKNQEKLKAYHKGYRRKNQEKLKAKDKAYHKKNQEKLKAKMEEYRKKNQEKLKAAKKAYREVSGDKLRANDRLYFEVRMREDPTFSILHNLRRRVLRALKGNLKADYTLEILGCSSEDFKKHLESLFQPGMTWKNYGTHGWHIDHIRPCASFNLADPEQQRQCFHFSNCQPLWAQDNLLKNCTWDGPISEGSPLHLRRLA